jgi:hypothetical protein
VRHLLAELRGHALKKFPNAMKVAPTRSTLQQLNLAIQIIGVRRSDLLGVDTGCCVHTKCKAPEIGGAAQFAYVG